MVMLTESALGRTGFFTEPPSLAAGDPYSDEKDVILPRHKGVQMKIAFPKIGSTPDALFDKKTKPLQEGVLFMDTYKLDRKKEVELQKSLKGKKAFIPPSPTKKPTGPGSTIGCLGPIPLGLKPEGAEGGSGGTASKSEKEHLKNFYTNPPKKGGAGFDYASRTIGGKGFGYLADEYQPGLRLTKDERKACRDRIKKPFNAGGRMQYPIAPSRDPEPPGKDKPSSASGNENDSTKSRAAFRPSSKFVTGPLLGYEYIPRGDPVPLRASKEGNSKPFKVGGTTHSKYTRYINPHQFAPIPPPPPISDYS